MLHKFTAITLLSLTLTSQAATACEAFKPFDALIESAKQDVAFDEILPKRGRVLRSMTYSPDKADIAPFQSCKLVDEINYVDMFESKYICTYKEPTPEGGRFPLVSDGGAARYANEFRPKFAALEACILDLKSREHYAYAHGSLDRGSVSAAFNNGTPYDGVDDVDITLTPSSANFSQNRPRFQMVLEIKTGQRERDALH